MKPLQELWKEFVSLEEPHASVNECFCGQWYPANFITFLKHVGAYEYYLPQHKLIAPQPEPPYYDKEHFWMRATLLQNELVQKQMTIIKQLQQELLFFQSLCLMSKRPVQ